MTLDHLGLALDEPGPDAYGPLLDRVPVGQTPQQTIDLYRRWRSAAEQDLAQRIQRGQVKIWVPLRVPPQSIVPVFGGDPASDWSGLLAAVFREALDTGGDVRVVDFTGRTAPEAKHRLRKGFPGSYSYAELGPDGSLDPLHEFAGVNQIMQFVANVLRANDDRSGRNDAAKVQGLSTYVVRDLDPSKPLTLPRLHAALDVAVNGVTSSGHLDQREENAILVGSHGRMQQNPQMWAALLEISSLVALLAQFHPRSRPDRVKGTGSSTRVAMQSVAATVQATSRELAHDVLGARLASDASRASASVTTVVLGADRVPARMLDEFAQAVAAGGSQAIVAFERLDDTTMHRLGWLGGTVAGFMRMPNHTDAGRAADFLGRRHTFVLAGVTDSTTRSFESGWSVAHTSGTDRSTTRSWNIGMNFSRSSGSSTSRTRSTASSTSGGTSTSTGRSINYERVYEHLVEPSEFQRLGDGAMLVVDVAERVARLVSCSRDVLRSKLVDWRHEIGIGE